VYSDGVGCVCGVAVRYTYCWCWYVICSYCDGVRITDSVGVIICCVGGVGGCCDYDVGVDGLVDCVDHGIGCVVAVGVVLFLILSLMIPVLSSSMAWFVVIGNIIICMVITDIVVDFMNIYFCCCVECGVCDIIDRVAVDVVDDYDDDVVTNVVTVRCLGSVCIDSDVDNGVVVGGVVVRCNVVGIADCVGSIIVTGSARVVHDDVDGVGILAAVNDIDDVDIVVGCVVMCTCVHF